MPDLVEVKSTRHAAGVAVRTNNAQEQDGTGRIPGAWQQFYARDLLKVGSDRQGAIALGVYTDYAGDQHGDYTLIAGMPVAEHASLPADLARVTIPPGTYLVFEGRGAFPKVVVQTWREIWRYFDGPTDMERTFGTDFEEYVGEDLVRIHIAVRERS